MVVAGPSGFLKNAYRKFSIRGDIRPGDDFAMMREVFERRFGRALKEDPERESGTWPDLVLIDGGVGQLNAARRSCPRSASTTCRWWPVAKGPDRDAGREWFHQHGRRRSSSRRATRCSTTCSGCGTRRTASPSPPTAPAAPRPSPGASWTTSPASAAPSSGGC
jgi:excinuclease UvrABC nuclease subunit